jgi:ribosomal protein L13E
MGFGKNNVLHANHFRKDWQRHVRTWFDQPGRKLRRRKARKAKAAVLGVRPLTLLRPAVRGQTVRYNTKLRAGRGFTLAELKEAGVSRKTALGVGIVVDHRRRNLSVEGKAINVERLKAYKERLVVFPRKTGKTKKTDSTVRTFLCFVFTSSREEHKNSPRILRPLQPARPFPFPPHVFPNSPGRLARKSVHSTRTRHFATIEQSQGLTVYVKSVQQRRVTINIGFYCNRSRSSTISQKEEEEAAKKK